MLNFENILRQYFPDATHRHQKITRLAGKLLGLLFHQHQFEQFATENPNVSGLPLTKAILDFFSFGVTTSKSELDRIPRTGRVIIVANHPIGSLDGIGLLDLVARQRSDVKVMANDMLWQLEGLRPFLLPVNNMGAHRAAASTRLTPSSSERWRSYCFSGRRGLSTYAEWYCRWAVAPWICEACADNRYTCPTGAHHRT